MIRRSIDLVAVALTVAALLAVVALMPPSPVRAALTIPAVFLLPGYALSAALFPRRGDADLVERIALSLGLSFAVVPMLGLALHYLPWGIHLVPILVSLTLLIAVAAGIGMYRRTVAPAGDAFGAGLWGEFWRRCSTATVGERLFVAMLALTAVMVGIGTAVAADRRDPASSLTEFYVVGTDGKLLESPVGARLGQSAAVLLGIVNREGRDTAYAIDISIDGRETQRIDNIALADGERWEQPVSLIPTQRQTRQRVEFILSKGGGSDPYRSLSLALDVPDATPKPAPSPSPSPSPPSETLSADR